MQLHQLLVGEILLSLSFAVGCLSIAGGRSLVCGADCCRVRRSLERVLHAVAGVVEVEGGACPRRTLSLHRGCNSVGMRFA